MLPGAPSGLGGCWGPWLAGPGAVETSRKGFPEVGGGREASYSNGTVPHPTPALARAAGPGPLSAGVHAEVLPRDQGEGGDAQDHRPLRADREAAGACIGGGPSALPREGRGMPGRISPQPGGRDSGQQPQMPHMPSRFPAAGDATLLGTVVAAMTVSKRRSFLGLFHVFNLSLSPLRGISGEAGPLPAPAAPGSFPAVLSEAPSPSPPKKTDRFSVRLLRPPRAFSFGLSCLGLGRGRGL